jgi:hypothetical protein
VAAVSFNYDFSVQKDLPWRSGLCPWHDYVDVARLSSPTFDCIVRGVRGNRGGSCRAWRIIHRRMPAVSWKNVTFSGQKHGKMKVRGGSN